MNITIEFLEKYIPFYKAELSDATKNFNRIGLAGAEAEANLKKIVPLLPEKNRSIDVDGHLLINISDNLPRYELWLKQNQDNSFKAVFDSLQEQEKEAWEALDLAAGLIFIHQQDSSLYTTEELNLDLAGFVSFDKGCYTGQEIVARMHFRGRAKKRLYSVSFEAASEPADKTLYGSLEDASNNIFNLLYLKDNKYLCLVVLRTNSNFGKGFWLGNSGEKIPAVVSSLNYPASENY